MNKLSIIIPTYNEENYLEKCVHYVRKHSTHDCHKQIIVVDGGSSDHTINIAQKLDVTCVQYPQAPQGRAFLLNRGADLAEGEMMLFLDADSIVPHGYDSDIVEALGKINVVGGAFEFTLDGFQFGLRVVEFINRTRYRIWKWYYGDQGIFVQKTVFDKIGGFSQIGLMEASEFCANLEKEGKLFLVKKPMLTSARRFLDNGIYRVLGFDIKMWWLNLFGRDVERYAKSYWRAGEA